MIHRVSTRIGAQDLEFETGRVAGLADGAVMVRYGDSVVLATVVGSHSPRPGIDFFPLTVDYEERMYADGKIVVNPTFEQLEHSKLDLAIAGTIDAVMMVEAGAQELPERTMLEAVQFGHEQLRASIRAQEELVQKAGRPKRAFTPPAVNE